MQQLEDDFNSFSFSTNPKVIAITGVNGAGKTHIAAKFAEIQKMKNNYELIWWIDAELSLGPQLVKLADYINLSPETELNTKSYKKTVNAVFKYLRDSKINWLLIFDNAESYDQIKSIIPNNSASPKAHVLVNSKNTLSWEKSYILPGLTKEEVGLAIKKISGGANLQQNESIINNLLNSTYLEIEQAATIIRNNPGQEKELIDTLQNGDLNISSPLAIALDRALQQETTSQLLTFISFMHGKKIPLDLIKEWYLKQVKNDELYFDKLITQLTNESLIGELNDNIYINNATQSLIRQKVSQEQQLIILNQIIELFLSLSEQQQNIVLPNFYIYINHAMKACMHAFKLSITSRSLYKLAINNIDEILIRQRDTKTGCKYIKSIESYFSDTYCPYRDLTGSFLNKKAYALNALGKTKLSYKMLLEAKNYLSEKIGLTEYIRNTLHIARRAQELGDLANADIALQEAEKLIKKYEFSTVKESILDAHFNQILYYHVKAFYFLDKGNYSESLKYANRATLLIKGLAKKFHANEKYNKLSFPTYIPQQLALLKLPERKSRHETISFLISKLNKQFGYQPHKFAAFLHTIYAEDLLMDKKLNEAEKELQLAIYMYEQLELDKNVELKKNNQNRYIAYTYKISGDFYSMREDFEQAIFYYKSALDYYKSNLLSLNIAEVKALFYDLIRCLSQAKEFASAKYYYKEYIKIYHEENSDIIALIE